MSVCPNHNWDSYSYSTDNGPVIVGFHTESNKIDQSQYPLCARAIITIKAPNHNGGPAQDEAQVLWDMEDRLVEALDAASVSCLLLGRLTHSGCRELVFQVADYTPFVSGQQSPSGIFVIGARAMASMRCAPRRSSVRWDGS